MTQDIERYREHLARALAEVAAGNERMRPYAEAYAVHLDRLVAAQLLATADSHGYEADPETDAKMVKLLRAVYFQGLAAVQRESARSDGPDDGEVKR